jgi:hypothetical protein
MDTPLKLLNEPLDSKTNMNPYPAGRKDVWLLWPNEPQCFKTILCQEFTFQLIFSHMFQTHPVAKIRIKNQEN